MTGTMEDNVGALALNAKMESPPDKTLLFAATTDSRATTATPGTSRWPPQELTSLGLWDSSRTSTPVQWSRGQGARSETPSTSCIVGCTGPLARAAALELHARAPPPLRASTSLGHNSSAPVHSAYTPRASSALGQTRVDARFGASSPDVPLTARERRDPTSSWPLQKEENQEERLLEQYGDEDDDLWRRSPESRPASRATLSTPYEALFRRAPPGDIEVDDNRPLRSRPAPPRAVAFSGALADPSEQLMMCVTEDSLAVASSSGRTAYGGKVRSPRAATSAPARPSAPDVKPHNAWCTIVEWVPPADGTDDPSFTFELRCRMDSSSKCLTLTDLGKEPRSQFNGLEPGTMYFFQVRAKNDKGESDWSEWSYGYRVPQQPGGHMRTLDGLIREPRTASDDSTSAQLEWDEPCSHGAPVIGYRVEYGLNPDDPNSIRTLTLLHRRTQVKVVDLVPNHMYFFRVQALNEVDNSGWTDWSDGVATKAVGPDVPSQPELIEASERELWIQWGQPFACGFRIERYDLSISCEDPTMERAILVHGNQASAEECKMHLKDLDPLHQYYFQVRAVSQLGVSGWSAISGPFHTKMTTPSRCTDCRVIKNSIRQMTVEFNAPESYRLPLTHFRVRWSEDVLMRTEFGRLEVPANGAVQGTKLTCVINDIQPGSRMHFDVAAFTQAGMGPFSEGSGEVFAAPDKPDRPRPPNCQVATSSSFLISTEDTTQNNGSPITRYELRWDTTPDFENPVKCQGPMKLVKHADESGPRRYEYPVTGFSRRGPYYFSVRCSNGTGASLWSAASDSQLLKIGPPSRMSPPTFVEAESANSLIVAYTPGADLGMKMGGGLLEYELRFTRWPELLDDPEAGELDFGHAGETPEFKVRIHRFEAPSHGGHPPVRVTGLVTGRSYAFQVRGISDYGAGVWSSMSMLFRTLPSVPLKPDPVDVSEGTGNPFSAAVRLTLPESNGAPIKFSRLQIMGPNWKTRPQMTRPQITEWKDCKHITDEDCEITKRPRSKDENFDTATDPWIATWEFMVNHLEPGAMYQFKFSVINDVGESPFSEVSDILTTVPTIPDKSTAPFLAIPDEDQTPTSIKMSWVSPHDGGGEIIGYNLHWATNIRFQGFKTIEDIKDKFYNLENLEPNQKYYAKVAAVNVIGEGKYSDLIAHEGVGTFFTVPRSPGPCKGIQAGAITNVPGAAWVQWERPEDDGGCTVSRYKVIYSEHEDFEDKKEIIQKAFREIRLHSLKPDTLYYFDVLPVNAVGAGPLTGKPAQAKTEPVPATKSILPRTPEPPSLEIVPTEEGRLFQLKVSWLCPEKFDKKLGFIYDVNTQTHMVLHYSVQIEGGYPDPDDGEQEDEQTGLEQIRDRRTVPKNIHNVALFGGMIPGRYYHARVKAFSEAGESKWSSESLVVRAPPGLPDDISVIDCVEVQETSVAVKWTTPAGNGEVVNRFYIRWREDRVLRGWEDDHPAGPGEGDPLAGQYEDIGVWSEEIEILVTLPDSAPKFESRKTISMLPGQNHQYVLEGLTPASFYSVEVLAANAVGRSQWFQSRSMRTLSTRPGPPGPSFGIPGEATNTSITFGWQAPQYLGGEDLLGYEVCWVTVALEPGSCLPGRVPDSKGAYIGEGCRATSAILGPQELQHVAEGLAPGTAALAILRCWTSIGKSAWTRIPVQAQIEAFSSLPDRPLELKYPPVIEKTRSIDHRPYSTAVHWEVPELTGRPFQYFAMRIYRADGQAQPGAKLSLEGSDATDGPPGVTPEMLVGEWVVAKPRDRFWLPGDKVSIADLHQDLVPGFPYVAYARVTNDVGHAPGWGPASLPVLGPADFPCQPEPPTSPWQWPKAIEVIWSEPWMKGAPLERCELRYSLKPDLSNYIEVADEIANHDLEKQEILIEHLTYATRYWVQIRVKNLVGWSPWSDISASFITGACRPDRPLQPKLVDIDMESLRITWTPPDDHGAPILKYDLILVEQGQVAKMRKLIEDLNSTEQENDRMALIEALPPKEYVSCTIEEFEALDAPDFYFEDLLGGIDYAIAVRAHNMEGPSDWSDPLDDVRSPTAAPVECPAPWLLEVTKESLKIGLRIPYDNGDSITAAEVFWERVSGPMERHVALGGKVTSEVATDEAKEGKVWVDIPAPGLERAPPNAFGGSTEAFVSGLKPGTEYDLQVRAFNSHGPGPFSVSMRMVCSAGKPDPPGRMRHLTPGAPAEAPEPQPPPCEVDRYLNDVPEHAEGESAERVSADQAASASAIDSGAVFFRRTLMLKEDEAISVSPQKVKKQSSFLKALGFGSGRTSPVSAFTG